MTCMMMGFAVGKITSVEPQQPYEKNNVKVSFEIMEPYFRYLWTGGSYAKINAAGFLNQRQLEVTRGTNGYALVVTQPVSVHTVDEAKSLMAAAPDHWQLAQDVFDANSNLLFQAYNHLEFVFNETNSQLLATAVLESNSIYIFDNKALTANASSRRGTGVFIITKFSSRAMTLRSCALWRCRRFPTSCRRWSRRCSRRCREFFR